MCYKLLSRFIVLVVNSDFTVYREFRTISCQKKRKENLNICNSKTNGQTASPDEDPVIWLKAPQLLFALVVRLLSLQLFHGFKTLSKLQLFICEMHKHRYIFQ